MPRWRILCRGSGAAIGSADGASHFIAMTEANDNDPYLRGMSDWKSGVPRQDNPYDDAFYGTTFWEAWFDGWDDAEAENKNFFQ